MQSNDSIELLNIKNNEKHHLTGPEVIIGRGWLNCNDNRISHHHGVLKIVSSVSVNILSTHRNPIFYKKRQEGVLSLIEQGKEIELVSGDLFGLTPDEFWFRIENLQLKNENDVATNCNEVENTDVTTEVETLVREANETREDVSNVASTSHEFNMNITCGTVSNMLNLPIKAEPEDTYEDVVNSNQVNDSSVAVKKEIKQEVKEEGDLGENTTDAGSSGCGNIQRQRRQCCRYGIRCYRRNPIHRHEQAHPGDTDYTMPNYGEPQLGAPPCPFGTRCYRRNPMHFKQFTHTINGSKEGELLKIQTSKRSGHENDVLLGRKRTKASKYAVDDHLSDVDDEDPFATDDDSDFDMDQVPSDSNSDEEDDGICS